MKLATFAVFAFASNASASIFNLRSGQTEEVAARIIVRGLSRGPSVAELEIISNSIATAGDDSIVSVEAKYWATITGGVGQPNKPGCNHCAPDDDSLESGTGAMIVASMIKKYKPGCNHCAPDDDVFLGGHRAFEEAVCSTLRKSGSANFVGAKGCSVSYLQDASTTDETDVEAQITLKGVLHDFSLSDVTIFDKSVQAAYNEAFFSVSSSVESAKAFADIDMVGKYKPGCTHCAPDDDSLSTQTTLVMSMFEKNKSGCTHCGPDDETLSSVSEEKLSFMQSAMEKALCAKLQNSGSANFANVVGCEFSFVYYPAAAAAGQMATAGLVE